MAGLRSSIVVCITSFLLGILFTHWIADSLTLWMNPVTSAHLWNSARYYALLAAMPPTLQYILGTAVVLGAGAIVSSLSSGEAGNIMFDGGSIFLYVSAVVVQLRTVIPTLTSRFRSPSVLDLIPRGDPFPVTMKSPTLDLASANVLCSVALTGVLVFQAARWWADEKEPDDDEFVMVDGQSAESSPPTRHHSPPAFAPAQEPERRKKLPVQPRADS